MLLGPENRVILMSGLPASGKTTTAQRLHASLGGVLIRQCDVYARLGIHLRDWVRKTGGFTRDVAAYERVRDAAYAAMLDELRAGLASDAPRVLVDAVHGETEKRRATYEVCRAYGVRPLVVWCRCDDPDEIRQRFAARVERDDPEHEASDLSVDRHIRSLWQAPVCETLADGTLVPVMVHDTSEEAWYGLAPAARVSARRTACGTSRGTDRRRS